MACIDIKINRIGESLSLVASRIGGLLFGVSRKDEPLKVEVEDVLKNQHLYVTCGIVCSVADLSRHRRILVASDEIFILADGSMFALLTD